ncbi:MAG: hypothetical protein KJO35_04755, partial [Gammaproteobacteria bacterium]|nr:hypothetical protein [Gammaproteobacteria bacterium]
MTTDHQTGSHQAKSGASLDYWLDYIEKQHPREIELGLDRVREVHGRLGLRGDAGKAISIAGTNGKGSCACYLEAIYLAAGLRVGVYTSPHLQH